MAKYLSDIRLNTLRTPFIKDIDGTTRITLATSTPHITLTGDVSVASGGLLLNAAVNIGLTISPSITTSAWTGVRAVPSLTGSGNNNTHYGFLGDVILAVPTTTSGHTFYGLWFRGSAVIAGTNSNATTIAGIYAKANWQAAATGNRSGTVTSFYGLQIDLTQVLTVIAGTPTITLNTTTMAGIYLTPSVTLTGAGTKSMTITTYYGAYLGALALSHANAAITTAYGLYIGDISGTSPVTVNLLEVAYNANAAIPYLRVKGNFTPAANTTPVYIMEGVTPTLRQLKTRVWDATAGHGFTNGDLVCYLV